MDAHAEVSTRTSLAIAASKESRCGQIKINTKESTQEPPSILRSQHKNLCQCSGVNTRTSKKEYQVMSLQAMTGYEPEQRQVMSLKIKSQVMSLDKHLTSPCLK
jgi:uncharacterized protein (DUF362 family)